MLKPFRIRNLYFNSSDLVDYSGVVQLSSQQYELEIQRTPEAVFAYLDEDDGEMITVGSSLELEQRLLEPPGRFSSWHAHLATDDPPPLHIFDIRRSTRAAEAWRKYTITYVEPSASAPPGEPAIRLDKPKPLDFKNVLPTFEVLELQVKNLKEAFKMHSITTPVPTFHVLELQVELLKEALKRHSITTPVRTSQPQRGVLTNACRNSDLSTHLTPWTTPSINPSPKRQSQVEHEDQSSDNLWEEPAPKPPKDDGIDKTALPHNHLAGCAIVQTTNHEREHFREALRVNRAMLIQEQGHEKPELIISDHEFHEKPRHHRNLAQPDVASTCRDAVMPVAEKVSNDPGLLEAPEKLSQCSLAQDTSVRLSADMVPPCPSLRQKAVETENAPSKALHTWPRPALWKSLLDLEPEANIARFPTIFELEKEGLRSVKSKPSTVQGSASSATSLLRANTVTSSNPAARLLKPFDPATEGFGIAAIPRRSGTTRHRRRPCADQFPGAGRTLWEEFERSGRHPQGVTPRLSSGQEPPAFDDVHPHPSSSIDRSQSLNHHHHPSQNTQSHCRIQTRSAHHLPGPPYDHGLGTRDQLSDSVAAAMSTPDQPSPPDTGSEYIPSRDVQTCIRTLEERGYKPSSRLHVYAEACDGNICKAMAMAEEDEKANEETLRMAEMTEKVLRCVAQLKEMGYDIDRHEDDLKNYARQAEGDVSSALAYMEGMSQREMDEGPETQPSGRPGRGFVKGMPGSFP